MLIVFHYWNAIDFWNCPGCLIHKRIDKQNDNGQVCICDRAVDFIEGQWLQNPFHIGRTTVRQVDVQQKFEEIPRIVVGGT